MGEDSAVVEGAISVKAVLEAGSREVFAVYAAENKLDRNIRYIRSLAEKSGVPFQIVPPSFFESMGVGKTFGGIIAQVGPRRFERAEALLLDENPFLVFLEGIEDPFNFGCAARSLYAAGATGLLVPERNWLSAAGTVAKSSAGASEWLRTAVCGDPASYLQQAKKRGIRIVCAERKDALPLYGQRLNGPLLLAVGGEKRGVSKTVFDLADERVYIPYGRDFRNSLTTSAACAVFAFEIQRQRLMTKGET